LNNARLLDERTRPDFRDLYGVHAAECTALDAAVGRIRLSGMSLAAPELDGVKQIRVLLGEMNALTLSSEADSLASDRRRQARIVLISSLFARGRLAVRIAPLAGWSPDFSVFRTDSELNTGRGSYREPVLMIGPHWFERPYPHPGPALGVLITGAPAVRALERFDELWAQAHDVKGPIEEILEAALRRAGGQSLAASAG
jgi:hypothetical protein